MRATSFFFTPSTDDVNGSTSSDDGLSEEADVPATGTAISTKDGGESKDGDTVVADAGMKESQSEEDDSSDLESFGNPDSPELPKGAEENLDDRDKKEEDHNLENAPAVTNRDSDWDYSRCNTCKHPNDPRQNALSPQATETYEDSPVPREEAWELFSWHIPDGIWKLNLKP